MIRLYAMARIVTVQGIVDWRLCLGCGACAAICPDWKIELFDVEDEGIRPRVSDEACAGCRQCLDVCPAHENDHRPLLQAPNLIREVASAYGPALELWEGHASDGDIRHRGSSGGLLTALSLYALERGGMHGVLHIGADPSDPVRNTTRLSTTRDQLLAATGSRYAPASACDRLDLIATAPAPCVFIGQPAEATALRKVQQLRPELRKKVGLVMSFFCAGSPATRGTRALLAAQGVAPANLAEVRYRGLGWPGHFAVRRKGESQPAALMSYAASWGFLQAYRPLSVHLTPDGSGEDADLSLGDPWYRPVPDGAEGLSLIVVRTEQGREVLRAAREAGYVTIWPLSVEHALASQVNLTRKRGAVAGRVFTMRLLNLPAPRLRGFSLWRNWWALGLSDKLKSTLGTLARTFQRGLYRPRARIAPDTETDKRKLQVSGRLSNGLTGRPGHHR